MTEYTKVLLEISKSTIYNQRGPLKNRLQLNISAEDEKGWGHGHRLAGPKFGGGSELLVTVELDEESVKEIRSYLAIWDEIQAQKADPAASSGLPEERKPQ